jgi:hypothetical protein
MMHKVTPNDWSKGHFLALVIPGLTLAFASVASDLIGLGNEGSGFGTKQIMLLVGGLLLAVIGGALSFTRRELRTNVILSVWSIGLSYALLEGAVSYLAWKHYPYFESMWLFEETGKSLHFDTARGYRLSPNPARVTRLTKGKPEYIGAFKGNNQGFPDRDNFEPKKKIWE